eukprot:TRINITY_DN32653_c0_g1_i1.p1 TRINITY_DN32653_c0_g1~~TRINITY_DN32653_c0_g1_i1.p1  ORF type:complete len:389 (-),score=94.23 TRINITY_DN32653_c0_g1_i1:34-1200(-)
MVRLELIDPKEKHKKFWEIRVENEDETVVEYGRICAAPHVSHKDHGSAVEAKKFMDKMLKNKKKKGYTEVQAAAATSDDTKEPSPKKSRTGSLRLECHKDGHNKFWQITVEGCTTVVEYGAIGAKPRVSNKEHASVAGAQKYKIGLVGQKKKGGYEEVEDEGDDSNATPQASSQTSRPQGPTNAKLFVMGARCSALELEKRRDDWSGGDGEDDLCSADVMHGIMSDAPPVARQLAEDLAKAMPDLEDIQIMGSSEGSDGGEIVVIGTPGPDPKAAILNALGIRRVNWESSKKSATLKNIDFKTHKHGFTRDPDEFEDFDPLDEFGEREKEPDMWNEYDQILAGTKILSTLDKGFLFNFLDSHAVAPVIFGGYASDGSIVGVLSSRVWT